MGVGSVEDREKPSELEDLEDLEAENNPYTPISLEVAALVKEKQAAYGDSFGKAGQILEILFPDGIYPGQYDEMLAIIRVIDKLFRIATDKYALGENPWKDVNGYSLLAIERDERRKR